MKTFVLLAVVALTAGQQFQQKREFNTAVRLAGPGFFNNFRSGSSLSSNNVNDNSQFQRTSSFQSSSSGSQNQGASFNNRFSSGSGNRAPTQIQSGISSFQQNQQSNLRSFNANNRDQFQNQGFQPSQQNTFSSNNFQQNNRFQSSRVGSSSPQTNNNIRGNFNQQTSGNQFQTSLNQQNTGNRFTPINVQFTPSTRFQSTANTQRASLQNNNQFQNQINTGSSFRSTANSQATVGTQSQSSSFQRGGDDVTLVGDVNQGVSGVFEPLNLPSGASRLLGSISTSFSCINRPYGYYADQDNSCRVFHVCNPALFSDGEIQTYQYSFMCGEGTVFDQNEMTCKVDYEATPCQEAASFYFRNEQFGRLEDRNAF